MTVAHVRSQAAPRRVGHRIGEAARLVGVSPSRPAPLGARRARQPQPHDRPLPPLHRCRPRAAAQVRRMRQVERVNAPGIRRVLGSAGASGDGGIDGRAACTTCAGHAASRCERRAAGRASTSLVSAIERGVAGASVASLQRLTSTYGTTVAELIRKPARHARVTRAARRPPWRSTRRRSASSSSRPTRPTSSRSSSHLAPGASSDGAYAHAGEEFLFVLSGALTVWVGEHERYRLADGDALLFPSTCRIAGATTPAGRPACYGSTRHRPSDPVAESSRRPSSEPTPAPGRVARGCHRSGRATPTWSSSAARVPGSRRSRASGTSTTPRGSA